MPTNTEYATGERGIMGLGVHGQYPQVSPEVGIVFAIYSSWPRADGDGKTDSWGTL